MCLTAAGDMEGKYYEDVLQEYQKELSNYFDLIVGYTGQFPRKPDISGTRYAMEYFGLQAKECIYVGDTDVDMKTGKEAGAYTIGVLWGFRERREKEENGANLIISNPLELLKVWENGRK